MLTIIHFDDDTREDKVEMAIESISEVLFWESNIDVRELSAGWGKRIVNYFRKHDEGQLYRATDGEVSPDPRAIVRALEQLGMI